MRVAILLVIALSLHLCASAPLIKVLCSGAPLFRGRVDSIVQPGVVSAHVHKIAGGSNFGPAGADQTDLEVYNDMIASPCTTCSVGTVDLSAYWHPDLYYRWPNGTLSLVPNGGLTVYYLARGGSGAQQNPAWKQFPKGFRMTSGNPFRRHFNESIVAHRAVNFACLSSPGGPQTHDFPTRFCKNGLRMQVHFPQCWDGVNTDSANHQDHMAFPLDRPDGGNCPPTHPVRVPNLFFEAFYSVDKFPHGPVGAGGDGDGTQRFVLANGDSSGYGFHGDFLNGWVDNVLQNVLDDPTCDSENTNDGNDVRACAPLTQFVQSIPAGACSLNKKIPITENIGLGNLINKLPGCNNITGKGQTAIMCGAPTSTTEKAPVEVRFHLKSELNGNFLSCPSVTSEPLKASISNSSGLTYYEVFNVKAFKNDLVSIANEGPTNNNLSPNGSGSTLMCNRGGVSDWEGFKFVNQPNNKVAIISNRNNKYISVKSDGTLSPDSNSVVGNAQLFTRVVPSGGSAF